MNEKIKIIEQNGQSIVSARELHEFLQVETPFRMWIDRMFENNDFEENVDYTRVYKNVRQVSGKKHLKEYAITLDTAKHISMIQRSEKGREIRKYFIDFEMKHKNISPAQQLLKNAKLLLAQEIKLLEHDGRIEKLEAQTITKPDYYTVVGYGNKIGTVINYSLAAQLGRQASKLCKKYGFLKDSTSDPRFGKVGMYPAIVLAETFNNFQI